jgi:hypothetical protein
MKKIAALLLLSVLFNFAFAQSKSYQLLREKFQGEANVVSFTTSGYLARTVLWMAGEHEYTDAVRDIRKIRLTVIPEQAFKTNNVTLQGFKKLAKRDGFEELAHVKDNGDDVTLLLQSEFSSSKSNRYLLLVDGGNEIVVMEITGYIDPSILLKDNEKIASD